MNLKAIAKLTRVEHSFMLIFGVIAAILLLDLQFTYLQIISLFLCPFFISSGAFALNDYFDIESDRINKKNTPIINGEISTHQALWLAIGLLAMGIAIAYPLGVPAFAIAVLFALLSVAYDWKLKDIALVGNSIIAASMAIVFIFTDVALSNNISLITMMIALISFVFGLAREILKTVQDVEGDTKARGSRTLPVLIGKGNSLILAQFLIVIGSVLALYLYFSLPPLKGNIAYVIPAVGSILAFAYASFLAYSGEREQERGRRISLYGLALGILAYILGGI